MRRLAPAVILFLVFALGGIAQAQTCAPPVVTLVGGANPTCAGQPVTLDAGSGWATYQWSPGGAATQMITDTPSVTTSYTVTTTDANGCTVTSQPLTVVVNGAAFGPPAIQGAPSDICPTGAGSAWIDVPSPDYASVSWTIQNGTLTGGSTSHTTSFTAGSNGQPVVLTVTVTDANGCPVLSSVTIPIRSLSAPVIHTYEADICPTGLGGASIESAPPGNGWGTVNWTIDHGTITGGNGTTNVTYTADASGQPAVLHVHVQEWGYCTADNNATIPIRSLSAPVIHTYEADICPTGLAGASIESAPPANALATLNCTIAHAPLTGGNGTQNVTYTA